MLLRSPVLEMLAATFTSGGTGQQLFLTDGNSNDPPLLLQMAYNCTDGPFMQVISRARPFQHTASLSSRGYCFLFCIVGLPDQLI
jgi:hypothetical protein